MKTNFLTLLFLALAPLAYGKGVRLGISSEQFNCGTLVLFSEQSSTGFDKKTDREMKEVARNKVNYIFTTDDKGRRMYVNHCPVPSGYESVPVIVFVRDTGNFSLLLEAVDEAPASLSYTLTDPQTMQVIKLVPGISQEIHFGASELQTEKKYVLNIFPSPDIHSSPVSCSNEKDGSIAVSFKGGNEWQAKLRNMNSLVARMPAASDKVLFEDMPAGVYYIEAWVKDVKVWEELVSVSRPAVALFPKFSLASDTVHSGQLIFPDNQSKGGFHCYWEFGNGNTSAAFEPACTFATTGKTSIALTICDPAGCTATVRKNVFVISSGQDETANVKLASE